MGSMPQYNEKAIWALIIHVVPSLIKERLFKCLLTKYVVKFNGYISYTIKKFAFPKILIFEKNGLARCLPAKPAHFYQILKVGISNFFCCVANVAKNWGNFWKKE